MCAGAAWPSTGASELTRASIPASISACASDCALGRSVKVVSRRHCGSLIGDPARRAPLTAGPAAGGRAGGEAPGRSRAHRHHTSSAPRRRRARPAGFARQALPGPWGSGYSAKARIFLQCTPVGSGALHLQGTQGHVLEICDLHKSFREGGRTHAVLAGASATAAAGEVLAITGRSGSGKSTLLNLVSA